jgi:hypothetical protein
MRYRSATVADFHGLPLKSRKMRQRTSGDASVQEGVNSRKFNHINKYRFIDMKLAILR